MTANPGATPGTEPAAGDIEESAPAAEAGADTWAKAVVDGVPDPSGADPSAPPLPDDDATAPDADPSADGDPSTDDPPVDADPSAGGEAPDGDPSADGTDEAGDMTVEDLVIDLERVTLERDQYLDASRRLQAEFENYRKQVSKRESEARERANDSLIGDLLPVLDAFDGAMATGAEDVAPMRSSFLDALAKQGLERIDPADGPFDPNLHEAVMHEDDAETDGPVVAEVMRAGYVWKGRVLRPAMVRTRG